VFGKILEVADVASLNEEERWEYDQALKHYRDYNNTIHSSYRQGKEEGKAEGKSEAIRQMVQNMQEMGMDIASIAKIARLSEEEVKIILENV
jgi:predicted transposase/invertase (TIGR01784 family)